MVFRLRERQRTKTHNTKHKLQALTTRPCYLSRETGAAATRPPADEKTGPVLVPEVALSRSTCRCAKVKTDSTGQLLSRGLVSACYIPPPSSPGSHRDTQHAVYHALILRDICVLFFCPSLQDVERPLTTRRGFTTTVGSITDLDPPSTLSARARKMCPEEVRGGRG